MGTTQSMPTEMVRARDDLENTLLDSNAKPIYIPLEFLKAITCDFSIESELGRGGYGVVYKGILPSGKVIAVKKLFEIKLKEEMFQNEVSYLMGIKHKNVVQFVGYCAESRWEAVEQPIGSGKYIFAEIPKRLLCFEYVPNKSLDNHISDESLGLEWNMRFEIIKGLCNGLHFLHDKCHIIHLDLKPENILMDSTMTPKITDFGLSRIFGEQQSRVVTNNRAGTCGYMAPEYLDQGVVSKKADIFSLGVIVIEIVTGRRDYPYFHQDSPHDVATSLQHFKEKVFGSWRNTFLSTLKFRTMEIYGQQVRQCITIALNCVDPSMDKRPTAKDIIQMLNVVDKPANPPLTQIIYTRKTWKKLIYSHDFSQTEPWIVTGHSGGYIDIWNYHTKKSMGSYQADSGIIFSIKFIERKKWFIAGSHNGFICVYDYETRAKNIPNFRANKQNMPVSSLAVHPTRPYVLSASNKCINLWDWSKNWKCVQTFMEQPSFAYNLTFNPEDSNSFVSSSTDATIQIWSIDSIKPKNTLLGHSGRVICLDFFTRDDQQYIIIGLDDKTVKIWDIQTQACIYTLEGFMSDVWFVFPHPSIPVLITATSNGDIHLWSSTTFRLQRIFRIGETECGSSSCLIGRCTLSSNRVVIGYGSALCMMEIHDEEPDAGQGSNRNSI